MEPISGSTPKLFEANDFPNAKVSRLFPRALAAADTLERLGGRMGRIPITRVTDLTPLDRLRLPVFSAVTPLALDLTTHLGKGMDPSAAKVSAIMEAFERSSAESTVAPVVRGSFSDLTSRGVRVVDPRSFDLPSDSAYDGGKAFDWIEAVDLVAERPAWLPLDLVINPPREGLLRAVDTNGLAAGNTPPEAVLHALCEVIERDAVGQRLFIDLLTDEMDEVTQLRSVDVRSIPDSAASLVSRIAESGCRIAIHDLTTEIGIATFRVTIVDGRFPSRGGHTDRFFLGLGTAPLAELALLRAINEAIQSRLAVVQGARDSFNRIPVSADIAADAQPEQVVDMGDVPSFESDDLAEDVGHVIAQLRRSGFASAFVVDLTHPDWKVPVVRVRVPGLTSFLVNRDRPGWRCMRYLL